MQPQEDLVMNPDLIPQPGVLFHLTPSGTQGESWVNLDTRGTGFVIGRVTRNADGTWCAWSGDEPCGDAQDADRAMWICLRAYLNRPESPAVRPETHVARVSAPARQGPASPPRRERRAEAKALWPRIQAGELPEDERLRATDFYDLLCEEDVTAPDVCAAILVHLPDGLFDNALVQYDGDTGRVELADGSAFEVIVRKAADRSASG
jgi:hypothetical protein